ncbi:MAG: DUF927 domain-containing protein [Candidatus Thiothrix singaporensis]|uniref:DUF927 domain-containing protein n=1 Tax=Candidatus Thiothrix singaporensis TaxID=2799669 RepID=A0A7L6AYC6_9GAMM|nr:MAG: DUF927 domain-containing protein [Candidatus Thiothrix singaporensis]
MPFVRTDKPKEPTTVQGETGTFTIKPDGVYFAKFGNDGKPQAERRICSRLRVLGQTRSVMAHDWGRLLEWRDNDGNTHRWAMPMNMLAGDGTDVSRELLGRGLNIAAGKGKLVLEYVQSSESINRMTCTDKTGWHGGAYVTPDRVYGDDAGAYIYQSGGGAEITTGQAGTLEEWRDNVSAFAVGNSRLAFAISTVFAGVLVYPAGIESGGFHVHGGSSSGKTTAQLMAASADGSPDVRKRSWRATANGLEGVATLHNDGLLILDEMREASAKDVSETAYMLGNGQGKTRSDRNGNARQAKTWRLLFLSSGEITLAELLQSEGKRVYAGQEVRVTDISADAGAGMGIFEELHGFDKPAALADHLRYATAKYYGTAGAVWLEHITQNHRQLWDTLPEQINQFCAEVAPDVSGQAHRVCKRFGLVAFAGELATRYGLTGWQEGEATAAAKRCFRDWLAGFGTGNREHLQILEAVRAFVERNGAKFQDMTFENPPPIHDLVGFHRPAGSGVGREYIVLASQFARVCEGFGSKQVIAVLQEVGWIPRPGSDGKSTTRESLPGLGQKRVYVIHIKED